MTVFDILYCCTTFYSRSPSSATVWPERVKAEQALLYHRYRTTSMLLYSKAGLRSFESWRLSSSNHGKRKSLIWGFTPNTGILPHSGNAARNSKWWNIVKIAILVPNWSLLLHPQWNLQFPFWWPRVGKTSAIWSPYCSQTLFVAQESENYRKLPIHSIIQANLYPRLFLKGRYMGQDLLWFVILLYPLCMWKTM